MENNPERVGTRGTILIVSGEAEARRRLSVPLQAHYTVRQAADDTEAVSILRELPPDMTLLVSGTGASDLSLLSVMSADPLLCRIPVVVIVGADDTDARCRALAQGAWKVLNMPEDPDVLSRRIQVFLQQSERLRPGEFSSEDVRRFLEGSSLPICILDPLTHQMLYRNSAFEEHFGQDTDTLLCYHDLAGRSQPCENCPLQRATGKDQHTPVELDRPDGRCVATQMSSVLWEGRSARLILCSDITERRRAEESLRISAEENLIVIQQSGKRALRYNAVTDIAENMLDKTPMFGISWRIPNFSRVLLERGILSPQSEASWNAFMESIRSGVPGGSCNILISRESGRQNWLHLDYSLVFTDNRKPIHAVISGFDNTELIEKELAYERWNTRLSRILTENTPYLEANITKDIVERHENLQLDRPDNAVPVLSEFMSYARNRLVASADEDAYGKFFDRKRMLALYYSGVTEDSLKYRAVLGGRERWFQIDLQMVKYPYADDVKGFFTFTDIDAEIREKERLSVSAQKDPMTGLLNKTSFQHSVEESLCAAIPQDRYVLFMLDMDSFKTINDTFGHQQGDATIRRMGQILHNAFRGSDLVGRVGGDEFMAFMVGDVSDTVIRRKAETLLKQMRFLVGNISTTVSIGISITTGSCISFEQMYAAADKALYTAKGNGKNTYCVTTSDSCAMLSAPSSAPEEPIPLQVLLHAMGGCYMLVDVKDGILTRAYASAGLTELFHDACSPDENFLSTVSADDRDTVQCALLQSAGDGSHFDLLFHAEADGGRVLRLCGERISQGYGARARLLCILSDAEALRPLCESSAASAGAE